MVVAEGVTISFFYRDNAEVKALFAQVNLFPFSSPTPLPPRKKRRGLSKLVIMCETFLARKDITANGGKSGGGMGHDG